MPEIQDTKPARIIIGGIHILADLPVPMRVGDDEYTRKLALAIEQALIETFEGAA